MDLAQVISQLKGVGNALNKIRVRGRKNVRTLSACMEYLWNMVDALNAQLIKQKEDEHERDIQSSEPD